MAGIAETKLTSEYLNKILENKVITNWIFIDEKETKDFAEFYKCLPMMVEEVKQKGKLIYFSCFNEYHRFFITHELGFLGSWRESPDTNTRWYIETENEGKLYFTDFRQSSTINFTENEDEFNEAINSLGVDILSQNFSLEVWRDIIFKNKNRNICCFLMDKTVLSGITNYLKCEFLYYAKISPQRLVSSLSENESEKLFEAIRIISRLSYLHKGMFYTDEKGRKGLFDLHIKIYNKNEATKTKTDDGYYTFWNSKEQI